MSLNLPIRIILIFLLTLNLLSCEEKQPNSNLADIESKSEYVNVYTGTDSLVLIKHKMVLGIHGRKMDDFKIYCPFPNNTQLNLYTEVLGRNVIGFKIIPLDTINNLISIDIKGDGLLSYFNVRDSIIIQSIILKPKNSFILNNSPSEWLVTTDCAQIHDERVLNFVKSLNLDTNKNDFVNDIIDSISNIKMTYRSYDKFSLDAISTIEKNGSCLGKTNLLNAILRSLNIPSRAKAISRSRTKGSKSDYHTINEFYFGDKWIEADPSFLKYDYNSIYDVELMLIFSQMEFPKFNNVAAYEYYYSNSTQLTDLPYWEGSLSSKVLLEKNNYYSFIMDNISTIRELSKSAYLLNNENSKTTLRELLDKLVATKEFKNNILINNKSENISIKEKVIFNSNNQIDKIDKNNWFIKKVDEEYQLLTNIEEKYKSNLDLTSYIRDLKIPITGANILYFDVLTDVEDGQYHDVVDKFWIEIIEDDESKPGITYLSGVKDDSGFNSISGWSKLIIDLSEYNGKEISLVMKFKSNESKEFSGVKIKNFEIINYHN